MDESFDCCCCSIECLPINLVIVDSTIEFADYYQKENGNRKKKNIKNKIGIYY